MKILDVCWFSSNNTIGIVATKNEMGEIKFYVGLGNGFDEEVDCQHIANYGGKIYPQIFNSFFERNIKK